MKIKFLQLVVIFLSFYNLANANPFEADSNEITIKLTLSGQPGQAGKVNLEVGVKKGASDTLDVELNEKEIPPFWPPSGLAARMVIYSPSKGKNIYSYNDYRGFGEGKRFTKTYKLNIAPSTVRQADKDDNYKNFFIRWETLSPFIDSARIQDNVTGDIININLKDSPETLFTNEFIEDLIITIHYNLEPSITSVFEENIENEEFLTLYPNPADDELFIGNQSAKYSCGSSPVLQNSF